MDIASHCITQLQEDARRSRLVLLLQFSVAPSCWMGLGRICRPTVQLCANISSEVRRILFQKYDNILTQIEKIVLPSCNWQIDK